MHVSAGGEKLVTVLMHNNQLMWAGLSPAYVVGPGSAQPMYLGLIRSILKKSKIFVSEFYNFPM